VKLQLSVVGVLALVELVHLWFNLTKSFCLIFVSFEDGDFLYDFILVGVIQGCCVYFVVQLLDRRSDVVSRVQVFIVKRLYNLLFLSFQSVELLGDFLYLCLARALFLVDCTKFVRLSGKAFAVGH